MNELFPLSVGMGPVQLAFPALSKDTKYRHVTVMGMGPAQLAFP